MEKEKIAGNKSIGKINITIQIEEDGFMVYDDTLSSIDFVHRVDQELLETVVADIVRSRINGKRSSNLRKKSPKAHRIN